MSRVRGLADVMMQCKLIDSSEGDAAHRRRLGRHLGSMLAVRETVPDRRVPAVQDDILVADSDGGSWQ